MNPALARYDVVEESIELRPELILRILRVRDVNVLVDAITELDPDERLPYWASLWPSAIVLARHLAKANPEPRRVLELGAGLGLPSLTAARLGHRVIATDYEEDALAFLTSNAKLNAIELETRLFDLRKATSLTPFPLILASDLLYEARQVEPLARAVQHLLAPGGTLMLSDPRRPHFSAFSRAMSSLGFSFVEYPYPDAMVYEIGATT